MISEQEQRVIDQIVLKMVKNPDMKPKDAFEEIKIRSEDVAWLMNNDVSPQDLIIAAGMQYSFGPGLKENFGKTVYSFSKELPSRVIRRDNISDASITISGSIVEVTDTRGYEDRTVNLCFDTSSPMSYAVGYNFDERVRQCILIAPQIPKYILRHNCRGATKLPIPFHENEYFEIQISGFYGIPKEENANGFLTKASVKANLRLGSYSRIDSYVVSGIYETDSSLLQLSNPHKEICTSNSIFLQSSESISKNRLSKRESKLKIKYTPEDSKNVTEDTLSRSSTDIIIKDNVSNFKGRTYAEKYFNDFLEMTEQNSPFITMGTVPIKSKDHNANLDTISNAVKRKVKSMKENGISDWRYAFFIVPIAFDKPEFGSEKACNEELSRIAESFAYAGVDEDLPFNYIFVAQ